MDAAEFTEQRRTDNETELSRLGSSKTLYAQTEGDLKTEPVLAAAADRLRPVADLLEDWAAEDGAAGETFAGMADTVRSHYEDVAAQLDDHEPGATPAVVDALAGLATTVERAGGVIGWALVAHSAASQRSGFFTGQADPTTASTFRDMRTDYDDLVADAGELLDARCEDPEDWDAAARATTDVVQAAYEEYVDALEEMGVNPKPVC